MRSTITAQPGLHSLYSTGSGGATTLAAGFRDGFHRRSFYDSLHGTRAASGGTCCSCRSHGYRFLPAGSVTPSRNLRLSLVLPWALSFRIAPRPNCAVLSQLSVRTANRKQKTRLLAALHDHAIGALVAARLLAQRGECPRSLRVIALHAAFTTTVRVIHRVHGHAANRRLLTAPTRAAGLAVGLVLVVEIADLSHRGFAVHARTCELRPKASSPARDRLPC